MKTEHMHKLSNDELRNLLETRPEYTSQAVPVLLSRLPNDDEGDYEDGLDKGLADGAENAEAEWLEATGRDSLDMIESDLEILDQAMEYLDADSPRDLLAQIKKLGYDLDRALK